MTNQNSTHTTQIWAASALQDTNDVHEISNGGPPITEDSTKSICDYAEEKYDQDGLLANPKPGSRAYKERERREMVSERQERKTVEEERSQKDEQGNKNRGRLGEGLNVERTFDIVEERNIARVSSS